MTPDIQQPNTFSLVTLYSLPKQKLGCYYSLSRIQADRTKGRIIQPMIENVHNLMCKAFVKEIKVFSIYILEQRKTNGHAKIEKTFNWSVSPQGR